MEIEELYQEYLAGKGVTTDTRADLTDKIFFALKGERFDGNSFAVEALNRGARLAVVDDQELPEQEGLYFVDNVLEALQELAAHHRRQLSCPVVAICGSNGKTTTKELTGRVLSAKYSTFVTPGNLNNHIGVPLSVLQITPEHEMAVIEIGANHLGETAELCRIADPDFGLITNIGKDHLEGFGSLEGVAKANGELFEHLAANKGLAFVNTHQSRVVDLARSLTRRVTYPSNGDFLHAEGHLEGALLSITSGGYTVKTHLPGLYNLDNVAAALCVGRYFDVSLQEALAAVAEYQPANNRSQWMETPRNQVIVDCYNANPSSMQAALENLAAIPSAGKPKVAVLADMAELGADSRHEHEAIGRYLADSPIDYVLLAGPEMHAAAEACPRAQHFVSVDALTDYLKENAPQGGLVLLKASRASKLERLVELL